MPNKTESLSQLTNDLRASVSAYIGPDHADKMARAIEAYVDARLDAPKPAVAEAPAEEPIEEAKPIASAAAAK